MSWKYIKRNSPTSNKLNKNSKINRLMNKLVKTFSSRLKDPTTFWDDYNIHLLKGSIGSAMSSIITEATNGLVINQVSISNSIQIFLTKFTVTVVRLLLTILFLIILTLEDFLISMGIILQTLRCWRYFWKNLFEILNYSLTLW